MQLSLFLFRTILRVSSTQNSRTSQGGLPTSFAWVMFFNYASRINKPILMLDFIINFCFFPPWIIITGVVTAVLLIVSGLYSTRPRVSEDENIDESDDVAPLIPGKDDDNSSWCSSYSSILTSTEELEGGHGEAHSSTRYLCAICFDAPRDCFFLSCGHCVACFQCGTR